MKHKVLVLGLFIPTRCWFEDPEGIFRVSLKLDAKKDHVGIDQVCYALGDTLQEALGTAKTIALKLSERLTQFETIEINYAVWCPHMRRRPLQDVYRKGKWTEHSRFTTGLEDRIREGLKDD